MSDWRGILRTEDIKLMAFNRILPTAPHRAALEFHQARVRRQCQMNRKLLVSSDLTVRTVAGTINQPINQRVIN